MVIPRSVILEKKWTVSDSGIKDTGGNERMLLHLILMQNYFVF